MLNRFKQTIKWWRKKYVLKNEVENQWNDLQISIVEEYVLNLSTTCDFPELVDEAWDAQNVSSFKQELKEVFVVPRLNNFQETQNRINKSHLVEAFLSFLLRLLHHVTDSIDYPGKDRIGYLEKELRFLLTILGDISWMLCDSHEHNAEFQNFLAEIEAVANLAGSMVHSLLFSTARAFKKTDEDLAAVFKHIHLLKTNLQSATSIPAYTAPRTSIVDSILILDSLVDDLKDLLKRKDDRIADVKDQIRRLHKRLMRLHSSINEMRSPQPSEIEELKEPLMRIGDMAYQAEYLITSFVVKDAPLWYVIRRLTDLNHKVKHIGKEFQTIKQKYQRGSLKVAENFSAELPLHDKRNSEANEVTIGFEEKTTDILYQLVGGGTKSLQVISILGMPGLGKTTLAKNLYNHNSVSYRFDKLAWCVVSQTYQMCDILRDILTHIESKFGKEEVLVEHIHKTLKGRRYLIVLDDIWDSDVLDELLRCFPDDGNGSRILLTSRNKDVAPPNSIIHELPFLLDEQCWELLEKKVFGSQTCPPELQGIGKKIAAKCFGLPLTVVVIAGVLSTVDKVQSTWEEVGRSLASYLNGENNSVIQTLELSYKHLPDHLKPCFLYFGAFEEDKEIAVGNLKRLWVAEGFIRIEDRKSRENIAEEYLMELIDRSLVMVAKRRIDGRGVKTCVVHDLLRDMCLKKSKEESFLEYLKSDNYTICEKGHRLRALGDSATLSHCQHVRSFYGDRQISSLYVRDMRLLRVLHFNYIHKYHIFGIDYLVNLRFLVIKNLPTWIDRLLNLEYLCVESSETVYLPPSIVKMVKLRYLHALFAEYGEDWSSYQTNNLECLSGVTIKKLKDEYLLKCSRRLRKLKCKYDTRGITDKRSYPCFDLRFLTQLDSLSLKFYHHRRLNLRKFGFPSNIRKLTLSESRLRWERMSIIGRLQNLEVLKLSRNAFEGERWDTRDGEFQKLRFLQLDKISVSQWNVDSNEHFPKLHQLVLIACLNLEEIPSEIGNITTLQLIEVKGHCQNSLVESAERIKEEQQDMGNEELRIIISTTD
ncbi:hypothetical protein ACS0TY_021611 [Phlomoides rotata]